MPSTTIEATRDEMIAEWVIRSAVGNVSNRVYLLLEDEDADIAERLPGRADGYLLDDARESELFDLLFPEDVEPTWESGAESCYIAARILRTIVYHAEHLRGEAQHLFELAESHRRRAAEEASVDA